VTPSQLGLKLLRTLPKKLISRFRVLVLADTGFSSVEFMNGIDKHRDLPAIVGIPKSGVVPDGFPVPGNDPSNRLMANGKAIMTITKKGQQVQITGFEKMVTASWFYLNEIYWLLRGLALELVSLQI
jgi:hypothetical protein